MEMTTYLPGTPSWVDLSSPDPTAAAAFYGTLFGWQVQESAPEAGGYRMAELRGATVAGIGPQMQPGTPPAWNTYISTDDIEATAKAVIEAGGQTFVAPMEVLDAGTMAVFADPTGAVFCAWQAARHTGAGLVDEPGSLSWNELTTRQPEAAIPFYRDVFGWDSVTHDMGGTPYTEWLLDGRGSIGGMMAMDANFPPEVPAHWAVYFAVADADATVAKVAELGGAVHVPPMDIPQGRFAMCADPQGAAFNVIRMAGG
jgi:predicted enzyme related to lactoylglutathione lyase